MITRMLDRKGARWAIGVVLPILMVLTDPAVFNSRVFGVGMPALGGVKPFAYVATCLAICALSLWLRRSQPSGVASGVFAGGALFATGLGVAILPLSLLGSLFLGVGLLGFTPFLMAAVYARAAKAAYPSKAAEKPRVAAFALGVIVILGIPAAVQVAGAAALRQSLADIVSEDASSDERGVARLRRWSLLLDLERLIPAYTNETDSSRRARIAAAYRQLTGRDAASRAAELVD